MKTAWAAAFAVALSAGPAHAQIKGAGSTLASNLYASWANSAGKMTELRLDYKAVGSGAGIKSVQAGRSDFGASDEPLSRAALDKAKLAQFPTAVGGVVVIANIPGIAANRLRLSGDVLAGIYSGRIRQWDHAAIKAINPSLAMPAGTPIVPMYRKDDSGTSFAFTSYLSKISADFKPTSDFSVRHGRAGRSGTDIANLVKAKAGAIAYVDQASAMITSLPTVLLKNQAGNYVNASAETLKAASLAGDWERFLLASNPSFEMDLTNTGCVNCWPIATPTYVLVPLSGRRASNSSRVIQFFDQAIQRGDEIAEARGYAALPKRAKNAVLISMQRWAVASSGSQHAFGQAHNPLATRRQ